MKPLTDVERIKAASRKLRGTLEESLALRHTGALAEDDTHVIKFHGSYQQDDRDLREERRLAKLEPAYEFMIRTRLPGGICRPEQWLVLDELARRWGNGTLRVTTRQAFQLHGVLKRDLKATLAAMNAALVDTLAACGDVNRNVICNPDPVDSRAHAEVYGWAARLSEHLLPRTRAYHEIWLDGEKVAGGEDEPIYGDTYLPRKFKVAFAVPPDDDVDVLAHDLGFIAILEDGRLAGFDVCIGGGMGATHGEPATYPRLADVIGFVPPERLLAVATAVVTTQRDYGDRTSRKHARLKYTIADRGLAWVVAEVQRRARFDLEPARPYRFTSNGDRFGWRQAHDGRWSLALHLPSGRIAGEMLDGMRELARLHRGDLRLTPNQNVIASGVPADRKGEVQALAARYGLDRGEQLPPVARDALACVALPTCGQAFAEAERYLPAFAGRLLERLDALGLSAEPLNLRITGCPNGCARPYLAEIALVGKAPGRYNLHVGGDGCGTRLNRLWRENADEAGVLEALSPLLAAWAAERRPAERFGDFLVRTRRID